MPGKFVWLCLDMTFLTESILLIFADMIVKHLVRAGTSFVGHLFNLNFDAVKPLLCRYFVAELSRFIVWPTNIWNY